MFWHPRGWTLFQQLIAYMRARQEAAGYVEVDTPDVMDRSLWEVSGHWANYRDHMFTTTTEDERVFALKPMNCPGGVSLFKHGLKSYRDLPLRMAEFGKVHRYEPSGALHGLMRVRHFTQDDAHIFCTPQQMEAECRDVVALVLDIYREFGFQDVSIKLSTRPANRMGDDATWDRLEGALVQALDGMGLKYKLNPGEGAFYGPKLEFVLAPVQVAVLSITEAHAPYAEQVAKTLRKAGVRAIADVRNEKVGYKVREQTLTRVAHLWVVGGEEVANHTVTWRGLGVQPQATLPLSDAVEQIRAAARPPSLGDLA